MLKKFLTFCMSVILAVNSLDVLPWKDTRYNIKEM